MECCSTKHLLHYGFKNMAVRRKCPIIIREWIHIITETWDTRPTELINRAICLQWSNSLLLLHSYGRWKLERASVGIPTDVACLSDATPLTASPSCVLNTEDAVALQLLQKRSVRINPFAEVFVFPPPPPSFDPFYKFFFFRHVPFFLAVS